MRQRDRLRPDPHWTYRWITVTGSVTENVSTVGTPDSGASRRCRPGSPGQTNRHGAPHLQGGAGGFPGYWIKLASAPAGRGLAWCLGHGSEEASHLAVECLGRLEVAQVAYLGQ